ncbi:MAG: DUF6785 family protein [Armatimonadota bacterium]
MPENTEPMRSPLESHDSQPNPSAPVEQFRWWVIPLGILLIPVNSLWIARAEAMDYSGFPTCASLFYNVIFSLMVLMLINIGLRRYIPRVALCRRELIVIYGMIATGSSLVGHDYMQMLVPTIPHVSVFATPENKWATLFNPHLPTWLTIQSTGKVTTDFEYGHSSLYNWEYIKVWLIPIAAWSAFLFSVIGSMLSIALLMRRHWVEHERLTYPIVQIPLLITEGGGSNSLFRNKLFWIAFSIAAGIDLLNGLAQFFPNLPSIPVKMINISALFSASRPWNAMGWTMTSLYPFVIGLSFFMPTNMAFSSWFFFMFRKVQQISASALGYNGGDPWYPYLKEQSYGALIALFAASLWFGRGYLLEVWRSVIHNTGVKDDGGISYRFILTFLGICLTGMAVFLISAGMSAWLAILYVVLYMMFCGALSRIRAELGPPAHEMGWVGTSHMMIMGIGTSILGPQNLTLLALLAFQNRMHRGLLMPQQAECLKAASESGLRMKIMVKALAIAGVVGVLSAFWALMHLSYSRQYAAASHPGAPGSAFSSELFSMLSSWLNNPVHSNVMGIIMLSVGAVIALVLARLSVAYYGFPFHPAGYALGMSFGIDYIWLPIMISWLLKVIILKYWGLKGYRKAIPFFVGLVLGEFAMGGLWSFIRGVLGVQTYTFFY